MDIKSNIRNLRIIAFFLFLTPALSLIASLVAHNTLILFPFTHETIYKFESELPGTTDVEIECNEQNDYCLAAFNSQPLGANVLSKTSDKLDKCNKYKIEVIKISETGEILLIPETEIEKKIKETNQKILIKNRITNQINEACILNSDYIRLYKLVPILFEKIYKLQIDEKTNLGTSVAVNPILYGETSVSNIVKRFPVKFIFKPLMYVSVILMIFYWYYNNLILNKILNTKIQNKFFIFGVLSAIFLLLHVIFLGWSFESELLTKMRRSFIIFFILFEVFAQAYLIKDIFRGKFEIFKYLNSFVAYCKLVFVISVCVATLAILIILSIINLDSKIDYILEWNYFLILLFFYLISSVMWKKN